MPRVFMSTLGTSRYVPVYYILEDRKSVLTPFIQEALVNLICKEWNADDRIVIFCTDEARNKNWLSKNNLEDPPHFDKGLEERLKTLEPRLKIEMVTIPEGKSESEIMDIFSIVTGKISYGDRITLDVTHSFRSLPILNIVILNYAKALKRIRVDGIYYGAFEVLGTPAEVRKLPEEKRKAPIFDLTPYDRILDWSLAVSEFVEYGLAERVSLLVTEDVTPILKEKQGKDKTAKGLKYLSKTLCTFTQNIRGARCFEIEKIGSLEPLVRELKGQTLVEPLNPLLDLISEKTSGFNIDSPEEKGFEAVQWCIEHDLLPQAYVILLETTLSAVCRKLGYDAKSRNDRDFLGSLMNVVGCGKDTSQWTGILASRKAEGKAILSKGGERFTDLCRAFSALSGPRNDFMHCGCREHRRKYGKLKDEIVTHFDKVTSAWEEYSSART